MGELDELLALAQTANPTPLLQPGWDDGLEAAAAASAVAGEPMVPASELTALASKVDQLHDLVLAAMATSQPAAAPLDVELAPVGEVKADGWRPCPSCGSTDADEFNDGTARCADCGTPLVAAGDGSAEGDTDPVAEAKAALIVAYQDLGVLLQPVVAELDDAAAEE